jgi:amidophosphoribosyltransferase
MKEKCGVVGIYSFSDIDISPYIVGFLEKLQHRGQESWGAAVHGHSIYKKLGLIVEDHIGTKKVRDLTGNIGIGHVRYSTKGKTNLENAHPIKVGSLIIAHNGTISNSEHLSSIVSEKTCIQTTTTDTELFGLRLQHLHDEHKDWQRAFEALNNDVSGAFSITALTEKGEILAARDEKGFRPLSIGYHMETSSYVIASESCAFSDLGVSSIRDVNPGELIVIDKNGLSSFRFSEEKRHAYCPFEYTYFSHPSSYLEGISVYLARKNIGKELAKKYNLDGDVVIPVPDSARPAAHGFSEESGIIMEEGLMKDRYRKRGSLRSFIEPQQNRREQIIKQISSIKVNINGKRVIVVDDSIVRGTSSIIISEILKKAGAKSIDYVITFPPIRYPCYAGIDFPTYEELIAYKTSKKTNDFDKINKNVASALNVNFVGYNDDYGLSRGIGLPMGELCMSCTTGDYSCLKHPLKLHTRKEMKT